MSLPKAQHFLPRYYLRGFALPSPSGKTRQVHVHDLEEDRTFRTSIRNVGQQTGFYDIRHEEIGTLTMEPALAKLDTRCAPAVKKLVRTRDVGRLSDEERTAVAAFCTTTYLRGPALRESMEQTQEALVRHFQENEVPDGVVRDAARREAAEEQLERLGLGTPTEDQLKVMVGDLLTDLGAELTTILHGMRWRLAAAPPGRSIPTSDCPLVRNNDRPRQGPMSNMGLLCRGIEVYFPLSADLLMFCFHEEDFPHVAARPGIGQMREEHLLFITHLLVYHATRFLISRDGDFELRPGMKRACRRIEMP